ncbi:MAG TPA: MFS transporter [Streptosporangiaceae bacterium]|jgi:MFS family permease
MTSTRPNGHVAPPARAPWTALVIMAAAAFMDLLDATIVQVALPSMQRHLHLGDAALQWVVSVYTLAFALLLITGARAGDRAGRRRCFLAGLAAFVAASAAAGAARSGGMLIAFRAVQGGAAAFMLPQVLTFVQAEFSEQAKGKAFAIYGMVLALAGAAGPLLGGILLSANIAGLGWRAIFLINVPVGAAAFAAGIRHIPASPADLSRQVSAPSVAVLTLALVAVFYPLIQGRDLGWPAWAFVMLGMSVPLLAGFALMQHRLARSGRPPMVDLALFRSPATSTGLAVALIFFGATSFFFILTLYLQSGLGYSPLRTGLSFIPFSAGIIAGSATAAPLGQRFGRAAAGAGTLAMTAALASMTALIGHYRTGLHAWQLAPSLTVAGIAFGIVSGTLAGIVLGQVPARLSAGASGVINTVIEFGSVLAIATAGGIFFAVLGPRPTGSAFTHAASAALWYLTICCAATTAGSAFLPAGRGTVSRRAPRSGQSDTARRTARSGPWP